MIPITSARKNRHTATRAATPEPAAETARQTQHEHDRTRRLRKEVRHSASAGEFFTVRCERHASYVWVEVEDLGGPWQRKPPGDRPHGLDIISALAGPGNWGTETTGDGDRVVWARLDLPCILEIT